MVGFECILCGVFVGGYSRSYIWYMVLVLL